jgi:hypothetical protein
VTSVILGRAKLGAQSGGGSISGWKPLAGG